MKKIIIICSVLIFAAVVSLKAQKLEMAKAGNIQLNHPRLLLLNGEEKVLKAIIVKDKYWQKIHKTIINQSDSIIKLPESERIKDGFRLLAVSRENFRRIFYLSYAYRMTNEAKYAQRAEKEMLKTAGFVDWNPTHFLDVAEMTMGMAIGYDWLYNFLSPTSRSIIQNAIIEKGINPSFDSKYNGWLKYKNNWNQVCNAGISFGAIAVYEKNSQQSIELINRAIESIKISMVEYGPDGTYPEGISYWFYGTSFNVMFISALEKIYKTDFQLNQIPGFLKSGLYSQQMISPMLTQFNYGDSKSGVSFNSLSFWFFEKTRNPALLFMQKRIVESNLILEKETDRILPAAMIWGAGQKVSLSNPTEPNELAYKGNGASPIAVFRSSWNDKNGIFLGFKLGSASVSHSHMDMGSFYLAADSVQWGIDLGMENYGALEAKGVQMWSKQRWDVFRYNNLSHNVLIINGKMHDSKARAEIHKYSDSPDLMFATSDLSNVHREQAKSVRRGVALLNKKYVMVEDEIETLSQYTKVRWNMATMAEEMIPVSENVVLLKKGNKKLYMVVETDVKIKFKTGSTSSENSYDSPNPNSQFVGFEAELPMGKKTNIKVFLIPRELDKSLYKGSLLK